MQNDTQATEGPKTIVEMIADIRKWNDATYAGSPTWDEVEAHAKRLEVLFNV